MKKIYVLNAMMAFCLGLLIACGNDYQAVSPQNRLYNQQYYRQHQQGQRCNNYGDNWHRTWDTHYQRDYCFNSGNYPHNVPPYTHQSRQYYGAVCYPNLHTYRSQCPQGYECQPANYGSDWGFCTPYHYSDPFDFRFSIYF